MSYNPNAQEHAETLLGVGAHADSFTVEREGHAVTIYHVWRGHPEALDAVSVRSEVSWEDAFAQLK